jgi:hypothetical protein
MPRGGRREGAGRKKGTSIEAARKEMIQRVKSVAFDDLTPLEFMLSVLRDGERDHTERMQAAIQAAPYIHPRLAASQVTVDDRRSADQFTDAELQAIAAASRAGDAETEDGAQESSGLH